MKGIFRRKKPVGPVQGGPAHTAASERSASVAEVGMRQDSVVLRDPRRLSTGVAGDFGIEEWVPGVNPTVDLVFIHGLDGHREHTWIHANGTFWPQDLLPQNLPHARILGFGYDARSSAQRDLSQQTFTGHANTLLDRLSLKRRFTNSTRRPIIFIAHSLGGLVLKRALIKAHNTDKEHHRAIHTSTFGIFFFGTPHQGGNGVSMGKLLSNIASIGFQTNKRLLEHLAKDSEWIEEQLDDYTQASRNIRTMFCYETIKTGVGGILTIEVVSKSSAIVPNQANSEQIEIHKDHIQMVKIPDSEDGDYQAIWQHMYLLADQAPIEIERSWAPLEGVVANERAQSHNPTSLTRITDDYELDLQLGYSQNAYFTGRDDKLKELHTLLRNPRTDVGASDMSTIIAVVIGIGGVGKTQLARQYAYLYHAEYTSVSWINCTSEDTTYDSYHTLASRLVQHYAAKNKALVPPYTNLAQHLGLPGLVDGVGDLSSDRRSRDTVVNAVKNWFNSRNNEGWLVVLDNVDDLETFDISKYLPTAAIDGKILITSRRRECARLGVEVDLDVLSESESVELLNRSRKHVKVHSEQEHEKARGIAAALGNLPLALDQAGSYIHVMQIGLEEYLPLLDQSRIKDTLSQMPPLPVWNYSQSVFSTWELSFQEIEETKPQSAKLLVLCSFISNTEIYPDMLQKGLAIVEPDLLPIDVSLSKLFSFSLVARKRVNKWFSIHPLVHSWARERLQAQAKRDMVKTAFRMVFASLGMWEIWTTGVRSPEDWQYERRITTHLTTIFKRAKELLTESELYTELAPEMVKFAHVRFYAGDYFAADQLYSDVMATAETRLGIDHPEYLKLAHGSATVKRFSGGIHEAEALHLYEFVLAVRKQVEIDGLDTLATAQSLAVLYRHMGRLSEAVELYKWALYGSDGSDQGFEAKLGPEHPNTIHTRLGFAIVLQHQGNYELALGLYEQVLEYRVQNLGPEHLDTLTVKQNLADISRRMGDLTKAEFIFGEVLDAREKNLGLSHPDTLRTADGLANVYRDQRQFDKSSAYYEQAFSGREQHLGRNHPDTVATVHNMAESFVLQGRLSEAKSFFMRALEGREQDRGPKHLDTLRTKMGLGNVAAMEKHWDGAEKYYSEVVRGFQDQMPQDCPDLVRALEALAEVRAKLETVVSS